MARYLTASLTTAAVPAGEWLSINQPVLSSTINLVKIKVVPNEAGGTARFQVYKRDTFLEADKLYDTREFTGVLIDPVEDYSDPMTDTPGATAERNEGSPIPYEDDDATNELHLRVFNGDVDAKSYSVTVKYEKVLVAGGAGSDVTLVNLRLTGTLQVDGASTFNSSISVTGTISASANIGCTFIVANAGGSSFGDLTVSGPSNLAGGASIPNLTGTSTGGVLNLTNNMTIAGTFTHVPNPGFTGSEGYGVSGFAWEHQTTGWVMGLNLNGSISGALGLLVTCNPSAATQIFKAESASYPNTFTVLGDGRVGIGDTPSAGIVVHVQGDQRPNDTALVVQRTVAGTTLCYFSATGDATTIYSASAATTNSVSNATFAAPGGPAVTIITSAQGSFIDMVSRGFGTSQPGCFINLGRNTSPACAGYINFMLQGGGTGAVWADGNGILRIGGSPPNYGDMGGTIVGAQTSTPGGKQEVKPVTPDEQTAIVQRIFHAPLFTYEVIAEAENGFTGLKHLGFMSNNQPMWMRYDENSIDEHRISMEILAALQELAKFVGFTPPPPEGPPAGMGRFINGEEGIKRQWANQDAS